MARVETMMAMDGPIFGAINPDRWAEERQYLRCDAGEALAAFRRRRQETLGFFRTLGSDQWQRGGVYRGGEADRPGREAGRPGGAHVTADNVLTMIARHDDDHLDQLRQALAAVSGGRPAPPLR